MISFQDELRINDHAFVYFPRLRQLKDHISSNYQSKIQLNDAASFVGMEKTYFSGFFKRKVGLPFTTWLTVVRLRAAAAIIEQRDSTLCEVAYRVGFGDVRSFQRSFKKQTGITPREFKRAVLLRLQSQTSPPNSQKMTQ